jgi:SNF2 family DNA or RNA helicase
MKLIFTCRLPELTDNQRFQRENLEESMSALGITMEIRTFKQLHKPMQFQPHQIIAVNWIAEKENSLAKGGLLADDCGTGKVRPCCALELWCSPHQQSADSDSTSFSTSPS